MHVESTIHPHVFKERADVFLADDGNSPELEYRDLLGAFVQALKPTFILETGTGAGRSTFAMALSARNYGGIITTIERDSQLQQKARELLTAYRLLPHAHFIQGESYFALFGLNKQQHRFDFCFLDSSLSVRATELRILCENNMLTDNAVIVVHDTSILREMPAGVRCRESLTYHSELAQVLADFPQLKGPIVFPLSRGLHLFQWQPSK
jgi:predicted O-methyltransferase YrrM